MLFFVENDINILELEQLISFSYFSCA